MYTGSVVNAVALRAAWMYPRAYAVGTRVAVAADMTTIRQSRQYAACRAVALAIATIFMLVPGTTHAQDFGVAESAETINRGNFKIKANPMLLFGGDNLDNDVGINLMAGYGFTDRFDLEGGVALYDNVTFYGFNAEYWAVRGRAVDVSVAAGLHFGHGDDDFEDDDFDLDDDLEFGVDTRGIDLTFLFSRRTNQRFDFYGALDFSFESVDNDLFDDVDDELDDLFDDDFTTVHIVPGIEYRLSPNVDVLAEIGIGITDESANYFTAGIAYYFRDR